MASQILDPCTRLFLCFRYHVDFWVRTGRRRQFSAQPHWVALTLKHLENVSTKSSFNCSYTRLSRPTSRIMELQKITKKGINIPLTQSSLSQARPGPDSRQDSDPALSLPSQLSQLEDKKHYLWDSVPSYRLTQSAINDFLAGVFGNFEFYIQVSVF